MMREPDSEFDACSEQEDEEFELEGGFREADEEDAGGIDRTDLLKLYLRDAGRAPMLNAAGEIEAAKRIERARARLMKMLSRSIVVAEYCLYLREALRRGDENISDVIERAGGVDMKPAALTAAALRALEEVSRAYARLTAAKPRKKGARAAGKRASKQGRELLVGLSRAIRAIEFTPVVERRLVRLVEKAGRVAEFYVSGFGSEAPLTDSIDDPVKVEQVVSGALSSGIAEPSSFILSAQKASAAAASLSLAKQHMTEANLRLVI